MSDKTAATSDAGQRGGDPPRKIFTGNSALPIEVDRHVPPDELQVRDASGRVLYRLTNIGAAVVAPVEPAPAPDDDAYRTFRDGVPDGWPAGVHYFTTPQEQGVTFAYVHWLRDLLGIRQGDSLHAAIKRLKFTAAASREAGRRERDAEIARLKESIRRLGELNGELTQMIRERDEAITDWRHQCDVAREELATARAAAEQARADTEYWQKEAERKHQGLKDAARHLRKLLLGVDDPTGTAPLIAQIDEVLMADAARGAPHAAGGSDGH